MVYHYWHINQLHERTCFNLTSNLDRIKKIFSIYNSGPPAKTHSYSSLLEQCLGLKLFLNKARSHLTDSCRCLCRAVWMQSRGWGWRPWVSSTPPSSSPPCSCLPSWSKIWAVNGPLWWAWPATSPTRLEISTPDGNQPSGFHSLLYLCIFNTFKNAAFTPKTQMSWITTFHYKIKTNKIKWDTN